MTPELICQALASVRAPLSDEKATQAALETALVAAFGEDNVIREARLSPGDVPDFMVGPGIRFGLCPAVAVEVKIKGAEKRAIYRQLERYAKHPFVTGLVLATGVSMGLPAFIEDTPAYQVNLARGWI